MLDRFVQQMQAKFEMGMLYNQSENMVGTRKGMNTYGNTNKTPKKKRHEKDVVVTKDHEDHVKGVKIRRKGNVKSEGISSLIKPEDVQGKASKTFVLCDTIVIVDNNRVVIDTINSFNDCGNARLKNVIGVILSVDFLTTDIGPDNPMHNVPTQLESKEVGYNIRVYKDITEDVNEDELVSEDVNDKEVVNDDFDDEILMLENTLEKERSSFLTL